jgi:hypothetical protein
MTDQPLLESEAEWFTDGGRFGLNGEREAGYVVVSHEEGHRGTAVASWDLCPKS